MTSYTYDLNGNVLRETLADGEEIGYTYDSVGRLSTAETSDGETYRYAYDEAGNLISYTDTDGAVTSFGYDAMGRLLSETDPNGATTTYAYDKAGRLTTKEDADGVSLYRFDPNGNLLTITDQATGEELFRYEYDALDRLTAVYDGEGLIAAYGYTVMGERYEVEEDEAVRSGGTPYGLRPYFAALRTVPIRETDGGGTPFNKTKAYKSYLSQAASAVEQAKKSVRLAAASASAAEGYAPGSAAAREAQAAYIQAKQAANRAQANYAALKAATTKADAERLLAAVQSNARAASQAETTARVCADRAASRNAPKSTPAAPTPKTAPTLNGNTTAQKPAVQSPDEGNAACSLWWERLAAADQQRMATQQVLEAAEASAWYGALSKLGGKGLDFLSAVSRYGVLPWAYVQAPAFWKEETRLFDKTIPSKLEKLKAQLNESTRGLAPNKVAYDLGRLETEGVVALAEAIGVIKLAAGLMGKLGGVISKLADAFGSFFGAQAMLQSDGSLVITDGGAQALTSEQIEAFLDSIAGAGVSALAAEALHLIAESSGIPKDSRQLKEDIQEAESGGESETQLDSSPQTYDTSNLEHLQNTEHFRDSAVEHIFEGSRTGGYHYEGIEGSRGKVIPGTESVPNEYGVYEAQVEIDGVIKSGNGGKSTFFPRDMSPQEVVDAINEAYSTKSFVAGNRFIGSTTTGMQIQMYLDGTGNIVSAFPLY